MVLACGWIFPFINLSIAALPNEGEGTDQEGRSEADYIRNPFLVQPG
jgi:hypothetical protein